MTDEGPRNSVDPIAAMANPVATAATKEAANDTDMTDEEEDELSLSLKAKQQRSDDILEDWDNRAKRSTHNTTWQQRKESENGLHSVYKMISSTKKLNTLKRAIRPKTKNQQKELREEKTPPQPVLPVTPVAEAYAESTSELKNAIAACADPEERKALSTRLNVLQDFYVKWDHAYFFSKVHIEDELKRCGPRAAQEPSGIKQFFLPAPEQILKSLARFYRQLYHVSVLSLDERTSHSAVEVLPRFKTIEAFHKYSRDMNAVVAPTRMSAHTASKMQTDAKKATENTCVYCGDRLCLDPGLGVASCASCGIVANNNACFKSSFVEMQQSSSRGAAPYERIAHVSISFFLMHFIQCC